MTKKALILIIILLMLLITGCNVSKIINSTSLIYQTEKKLTGNWSKKVKPQNGKYRIITNENKEIFLKNWRSDKNKPYYQKLNKINLKNKVAILAYLGEMPTGGYKIQIDKIAEKDEKLLVKVKYVSPAPDDAVTMALTYPYDLVVLSRDKFKINKISNLDLVVVNQNEKIINN